MSHLHWWPHSPADWQQTCAGLDFEQRGALLHVFGVSWQHRDPVGTIVNTPAEFKHLLGTRWKRLLPVIQQHFKEDADYPGLLRCVWLADLFAKQSGLYRVAADKGERGRKIRSELDELARKRGQTNMFRPPKEPKQRRLASSSAKPTPVAQLTGPALAELRQKLEVDSSLEPRTGDADTAASYASASPQIVPPAWDGPDELSLRAWAEGNPEISNAVRSRLGVISGGMYDQQSRALAPKFCALWEREALKQEWLARHAEAST